MFGGQSPGDFWVISCLLAASSGTQGLLFDSSKEFRKWGQLHSWHTGGWLAKLSKPEVTRTKHQVTSILCWVCGLCGGSQETAKSKKDTSLALVESVDQSGISVMQGLPWLPDRLLGTHSGRMGTCGQSRFSRETRGWVTSGWRAQGVEGREGDFKHEGEHDGVPGVWEKPSWRVEMDRDPL